MTQVTVAAPAPAHATPHALTPARRRVALARAIAHVPVASAVLAAAWWVIVAARWWGGRAPGAVTGGAILTGLAIVATRPDRVLPRRAVWLALIVSAAAFIVALTSPTGWAGASNAAEYVCAAWTVVIVASAVVRDRRTVNLVVAIVVFGVLIEFSESWVAWHGGGTADEPLIGTFYWHDPFAAYLIAGTALGFAMFLTQRRSMAILGLIGFLLGSVGVVYSTSRAAGVCLAIAVALVALGFVVQSRLHALPRLIGGCGFTAFAVWAIAGPPFFPHRSAPLAGTAVRASGQSLSQNGGYRVDFWHEAIGIFRRFPLTGGGFHSMASASVGHVQAGWPLSPLAHNGYLQAFSDGGIVLGVPFIAACAGIAWLVLRSLAQAVRRRDYSVTSFVLPLSLGALMVHSAVDFDWSYPADFMLTAVIAGLVLGNAWLSRDQSAERPGRRVTAGVALAGVALTSLAAVTAWSGDLRLNLPISSTTQASAR